MEQKDARKLRPRQTDPKTFGTDSSMCAKSGISRWRSCRERGKKSAEINIQDPTINREPPAVGSGVVKPLRVRKRIAEPKQIIPKPKQIKKSRAEVARDYRARKKLATQARRAATTGGCFNTQTDTYLHLTPVKSKQIKMASPKRSTENQPPMVYPLNDTLVKKEIGHTVTEHTEIQIKLEAEGETSNEGANLFENLQYQVKGEMENTEKDSETIEINLKDLLTVTKSEVEGQKGDVKEEMVITGDAMVSYDYPNFDDAVSIDSNEAAALNRVETCLQDDVDIKYENIPVECLSLGSKWSGAVATSRAKKRPRESEDRDSELSDQSYSDEDVYSLCPEREMSSSADESGSDSDVSICNTRVRQLNPKSSESQPGTCGSSDQPSGSSERNQIGGKRSKPVVRNEVSTTTSNIAKTPESSSLAPMPTSPAPLPSSVQDYGLLPDIPDSLLMDKASTPTVSLLRSDTPEPTLSSESDFIHESSASPTLRSDTHTPDLSSDNGESQQSQPDRFNNSSPSRQATSDWSTSSHSMKIIEFTKEQGLLVQPPSDPYEAFRLLIDDDLLDMIVHETNANASRVFSGGNATGNSRIAKWKDLTRGELLTFLGLLIHTGTIRLNRISDYWKKHYLFNIPCFGQFMSRNRFLFILRCLNFTSETGDEDRLIKIRPIMDHFNNKMKTIYTPGKQLSLDESMVLWRGRLLFGQYIKNKRHKYGIKMYVLAEPDGTVLKYQVYAGANGDTCDQGHASKIVLKLLEERLDCGHSVYMDNYFNSYGLAVQLLDRQTYCTGTLREGFKDNPVEIGTISLEKGQNKSLFLNGVHIGKWRDKRCVLYLSTEHGDEMLETISKKGSVVFKPSAIVHYNNFMSDIDLQNQMLAYYPIQRKTLRWYKKIFVHMLQMTISNAMYLYNKYSSFDKMNLYEFRLKTLESLLPNPEVANRRNVLTMKHKLTKIEKTRTRLKKVGQVMKQTTEVARKECKGCKAQKKRVQTVYECKECEGSPGFCTKCFCEAHS